MSNEELLEAQKQNLIKWIRWQIETIDEAMNKASLYHERLAGERTASANVLWAMCVPEKEKKK